MTHNIILKGLVVLVVQFAQQVMPRLKADFHYLSSIQVQVSPIFSVKTSNEAEQIKSQKLQSHCKVK